MHVKHLQCVIDSERQNFILDPEKTIYFRYEEPMKGLGYVCSYLIDKYLYLLQVIIEGVAGVTFASNIAVDDFNFSTNLTCVSVGKPTPPETFEGNVFLTRGYSCNCSFASCYAVY